MQRRHLKERKLAPVHLLGFHAPLGSLQASQAGHHAERDGLANATACLGGPRLMAEAISHQAGHQPGHHATKLNAFAWSSRSMQACNHAQYIRGSGTARCDKLNGMYVSAKGSRARA